jgi:phospholipase/carboxylesterase
LGAFETFHETVLFDRSGTVKGGLPEGLAPALKHLEGAAADLGEAPLGSGLREAVGHLHRAEQALAKPGADPSLSFLEQRREYCRALRVLYPIRQKIPELSPFWLLPSVLGEQELRETRTPGVDVPVGLVDRPAAEGHGAYSLYVPESYTPTRTWPTIVALHGAYGRGDEYIFSWLRPAKSRGFVVIAPNSRDVTWSILRPPLDAQALLAVLDDVSGRYALDPARVFLSGLSDGGTFTYLAGLPNAERFAGISPIAGDFHAMMDPMLRRKMGQSLPILIVHGAKDPLFPVRSIRSAYELMTHLEYHVSYEELPEWGHAYPYSIHERLVLPWFEALVPPVP